MGQYLGTTTVNNIHRSMVDAILQVTSLRPQLWGGGCYPHFCGGETEALRVRNLAQGMPRVNGRATVNTHAGRSPEPKDFTKIYWLLRK